MTLHDGVWLSWSGGKDSALALLSLRRQGIPVAGLLSTVVGSPPVVPFHGIPLATLRQQAQALELPLWTLRFPQPPSDLLYAHRLRQLLRRLRCRALAFGDIFLEDVRRYRERTLEGLPIHLLFPLWQRPSTELAADILRSRIHAILTSVDARLLNPSWLGRPYDETFLHSLPPEVDPCGERGEFHTCILYMPGFRFALIPFRKAMTTWADHWHVLLIRTRQQTKSQQGTHVATTHLRP